MPKLLDFNKFCENLKEVSSIKIMDKKKFHKDGLFSEQIFGPIKNYTCQCGKYYGASRSGSTCKECGVDIVNSSERRRRFSKIVLPMKVISPVFYDLIMDISKNSLKSRIDRLLKSEKSVMFKSGDDYEVVESDEEIDEKIRNNQLQVLEGYDAIFELVNFIAEKNYKMGVEEWGFVIDNIDQLLIDNIIVLPSDLRPAARGVERNNQVVDQINRYYMQLLTKKEIMRETIVDVKLGKSLFYQYFRQIQNDVNELYSHILGKLSKKEGLIRGNILGKRIDFSGRAVIVPDPTLKLDECSLPYLMILELFKLQIAKRLIELGKFKILNISIDFVDECIEFKKPILYNICNDIIKGEVCILNRQPSLHRLSLLGFKIKMSLDFIIKIHPLACPCYNADFDGDQMAVYVPISKKSKQEILDKLLITKNLINPANGNLTAEPSQDIILGVYTLTNNEFDDLLNEIEYKGEKITESRRIFNQCLPEDYPLVNYIVKKKELLGILNDIVYKYPESITAQVLDEIKKIGFKYSTLFGATLSLSNFAISGSKELKNEIYNSKDIHSQLIKLSSKETNKFLKDNFFYSYMIESGARGSWDQAKQIVLTRGFISNFKGEILKTPIKNGLLDGLTQEEFFNSTYGCRKGLLDVALNTGVSGYLSRKLIFTCVNLQVDQENDDCGTTDYLNVYVKDHKKARMMVGKYYLNNDSLDVISKENYIDFIGKHIKVRSPIFCKKYNICHKCYGDLHKVIRSRFAGIIAAQSLGECNTQLVLRTFHVSGIANVKEGSESGMKQQDIVSDLSSVSRLLHHLKNVNFENLVSDLFDVYNTSRSINHVHFECVVAQLMWHGNRKWRLLPDRDKLGIELYSVQNVPSKESWLMGLAFSNPRKHILKGILNSGNYKGVFDRILLGEEV